jgi:S1-C subfamily serine protease
VKWPRFYPYSKQKIFLQTCIGVLIILNAALIFYFLTKNTASVFTANYAINEKTENIDPNLNCPDLPKTPETRKLLKSESTPNPLIQDLNQKIRNLTVRVITKTGAGSGVFLDRRLVITNRHVVENQRDNIFVTSKELGALPIAARLIAATHDTTLGQPDFAILEIAEPEESLGKIKIGPDPTPLNDVVAAGYPATIVDADDDTLTPDVVMSTGTVQVLQVWKDKPYPLIVHTASISPGSSGGGLFDRCGNLIGLNTFVMIGAPVYYALTGGALRAFLDRNNINYIYSDEKCALK